MRSIPHVAIFTAACLFIPALDTVADDSLENWAHWRGHHGNGSSTTATPPTTWSEDQNIKWKVAIPGRGSGSPVVWGDQVFVVSAVGGDTPTRSAAKGKSGKGKGKGSKGRGASGPLPTLSFQLFCIDRQSGEIAWQKTATTAVPHEGTHQTNGYASASPCTDGERVYAHFGSRGLYCYDMQGSLLWSRDDFGQMQTRASFGEGSSPTLAGDKILVPWDHEGASALYALDKLTGQTVWQTERDEPTCWATPLVVAVGDRHQVILNGENYARSYDLATGQEIWRCGGQTQRPVASPVCSDGVAIIGSGFRGSFIGAFQLDGTGDIAGTEQVVWTTDDDTPDIASPLLSAGRLYYHKGKTGILSCVDATTGQPHFGPSRIDGVFSTYASPVAAGGYVYLTGRSGTTVVIKDAENLEIVATNSVGEGVDATPAPVGEQLFIRGEKHLFCIE